MREVFELQVNVKEILTAAAALDVFEKVLDRPVVGKDDVPAFVILGRSKDFESFDTGNTQYNGAWEYQCLIADEMDKDEADSATYEGTDYTAIEGYFTSFCTAFLGDGAWKIEGLVDFAPYAINGRELLGVAFTLAKHQMDRF